MESSDAVDDLQRRILQLTLQEVALREDQDTEACMICWEILTNPCEPLTCGHCNFDQGCIRMWLEQSPRCPLCHVRVPFSNNANDDDIPMRHGPSQTPWASASDRLAVLPDSLLRGQRAHPVCPLPRPLEDDGPWPINPSSSVASAQPEEASITAFRSSLYREHIFSAHVGTNSVSAYREITPALFLKEPNLVRRARMFIRRELQLFSFVTHDDSVAIRPRAQGLDNQREAVRRRRAGNSEFLLAYIIAILKSVDIMGSAGLAEEMLCDFLRRDNARHFLHELRAWLRSPYETLEDWDRHVQYPGMATNINAGPNGTAQSFRRRPVLDNRQSVINDRRRVSDDRRAIVNSRRRYDCEWPSDVNPRRRSGDALNFKRHAGGNSDDSRDD